LEGLFIDKAPQNYGSKNKRIASQLREKDVDIYPNTYPYQYLYPDWVLSEEIINDPIFVRWRTGYLLGEKILDRFNYDF